MGCMLAHAQVSTNNLKYYFRFQLTESNIYIYIYIGSLNGQINLEFEIIQTLYGVKRSKYTKGQTVTQESTGASGVVYSSTSIRLFGFTCNNCVTYIGKSDRGMGMSCASEPAYSYTDSYLQRGLKLTQGSGEYRYSIITDINNYFLYIIYFSCWICDRRLC